MIVYFDNCVWQRLFEPLTEKKKKEKDVIEELLKLRQQKKIRIASSDANEAEFLPLLDKGLGNKKDKIWDFVRNNTDVHLPTSYGTSCNHSKWNISNTAGFSCKETENLIKDLMGCEFKHDDAVHIATALEECVSVFVTVDNKSILKKVQNIDKNLFKRVVEKHPKEKLRKLVGATSSCPMKILYPKDALQEVNKHLEMYRQT